MITKLLNMYQVLLLTGYCCKNKFIHESNFDSNSWIANLGNHNECNNSYLSVIIQNRMPIGSQTCQTDSCNPTKHLFVDLLSLVLRPIYRPLGPRRAANWAWKNYNSLIICI